ncbi:MAG: A24 family peptidase C-terminal domain-containing protein [Candidatus Methanomethylicia archaeon]
MLNEVYYIRYIVAIICFSLASLQDLKSREICDWIWIIMVAMGIPLLIYEATIKWMTIWMNLMVISILFSITIGLLTYKLDFFGGADSKAIIALSILMPIMPEEIAIKLGTHNIIPVSTFNNSMLISIMPAIYLLMKNVYRIIIGENIFQGLEEESILKKLLAMATGYRIELKKLREKKFVYPIEELNFEGNTIKRRLNIRVGISIGEDKLNNIIKLYEEGLIGEGYIWVTPAMPLIVFMLIGLILTLTYGDIIFKCIVKLSMGY